MSNSQINLMEHLEPLKDRSNDVRRYFSGSPGDLFSGRLFEQIGQSNGVVTNVDTFQAEDIVAVSALSVNVPPEHAATLIKDEEGMFRHLLAAVLTIPMWELSTNDYLAGDSAASELWQALRSLKGMGPVTTSKLMAHKRPHTIPVFDRVIENVLAVTTIDWWERLRISLTADVLSQLQLIRATAGVPETVSLLRILDVAIWMPNHTRFRD